MVRTRSVFAVILFLLAPPLAAQAPLRAGVATGFPPYQYSQDGHPAGLDVELAEAVAREAGRTLVWTQGPWDEITATLRFGGDLDLVVGMEQTGERLNLFRLGTPLYNRRNVLFLLAKGRPIERLEDLAGLAVARDLDSYSEELLGEKGIRNGIRLVKTESKQAAFAALLQGTVVAAFMPEAVGWSLARQAGVAVRTLDLGDVGSPVGLAFRKGNDALANSLDAAVARLVAKGTLKSLLSRWQSRTSGTKLGR